MTARQVTGSPVDHPAPPSHADAELDFPRNQNELSVTSYQKIIKLICLILEQIWEGVKVSVYSRTSMAKKSLDHGNLFGIWGIRATKG